jgi:hypothetical protein
LPTAFSQLTAAYRHGRHRQDGGVADAVVAARSAIGSEAVGEGLIGHSY